VLQRDSRTSVDVRARTIGCYPYTK